MAIYDFAYVYLTWYFITHTGITFIYLKNMRPRETGSWSKALPLLAEDSRF